MRKSLRDKRGLYVCLTSTCTNKGECYLPGNSSTSQRKYRAKTEIWERDARSETQMPRSENGCKIQVAPYQCAVAELSKFGVHEDSLSEVGGVRILEGILV